MPVSNSDSNVTNSIPPEFTDYLSQVCRQIRWKKAHPSIQRELSDHMKDQMDEYISRGILSHEAVQKTVQEMGDPVQIGTQLDRTYRPKIDKGILLLAGLLLIMGFFMQTVFYVQRSISCPWPKIATAVIIGVCGMLAVIRIDYTVLAVNRITSGILYLAYNLVILLFPITHRLFSAYGFTNSVNYLFAVFGQYLFLLFPLVFCGLIYSFRNQGLSGFLICGGMAAASLFLMVMNSRSFGLIIAIPCLAVLSLALKLNWFGISPGKKTAAYALMFGPAAIFCCAFAVLARNRIYFWIHPSADPRNQGYFTLAVRSALASSKWIGHAEPLSLPIRQEQFPLDKILIHTPDLLLTWMIAVLGWWILCVVLPPALLLCWKGIQICRKQSNLLGKMVSFTVVFTLAVQFFFFLLTNLTGFSFGPFPFPFLQGNGSIIVNFILLGFLLSAEQRKGLDEKSIYQTDLKFPVNVSVQRSSREVDISFKLRLPDFKRNWRKR